MDTPTFERHPTDRRRRAFIKVQDGCRNRCSFCVVTLARGDERSRTVEDVVEEVRQLVAAGREEVVLTGVHLGGYGSDLSTAASPVHLTHLMRAILEDTDVRRLRVGSLEPWDLPPDFERLWVDHPRLMPHLHLPAQSGSPTVLQRMRRRNPPDRYLALVERLRAAHPRMQITTDLIVGFPGETADEFAETCAFVDRVGFSDAHVFVWSPRPGTRAATLPERVDKPTAKARSAALHQQIRAHRGRALSTRVGSDVEVLVERIRPSADGAPVAMGYSEEYLPVRVLGASPDWVGTVVCARVQSADHDALWASTGHLRAPV
jgi:threonylcarbamoyladenosine tRNA methylthiotransferase MtaB